MFIYSKANINNCWRNSNNQQTRSISTTIYFAKIRIHILSVGIDIDPLRLQIAKKRAGWYHSDRCEFINLVKMP